MNTKQKQIFLSYSQLIQIMHGSIFALISLFFLCSFRDGARQENNGDIWQTLSLGTAVPHDAPLIKLKL